MPPEEEEPSFGLSGSIIQERQRLFEEKLNRSRQLGSNPTTSTPGPSTTSQLGRQGPQQFAPVHIRPADLPLDARVTSASHPSQPEVASNGTRLVPRPLPGFSTKKEPNSNSSAPAPTSAPSSAESLIPPFLMPYHNQRALLLVIAFLLQFAKFFLWRTTIPTGTNFVYDLIFHSLPQFMQWFTADALLFGLLVLLRVPKLSDNFFRLALGFFFLQFLNVLFLVGLTPFFTFLLSLILPKGLITSPTGVSETTPALPSSPLEIGLGSQKEISREELLLGSSHLLGRYTIKILPDSTVKMNPDGLGFCLNQQSNRTYDGPVHIPIYINGTNPFKLKYTFTNLQGQRDKVKEIILARFASDHLVDSDSQLTTGTYLLAAKLPGRYTLEGVLDKEEYSFRQGPQFREVVVAPCPRASFTSPEPTKGLIHCLGSPVPSLQITASGIPPFQVTYSHQVNSSEHLIRLSGEKGLPGDSPVGTLALEEISESFPLELNFLGTGHHHYRVTKIRDRFHNLVTYEESTESSLVRDVQVHSPPVVRSSCDLGQEYSLSPKYPRAAIPIYVTGSDSGPFHVKLGYCPVGSDETCHPELIPKQFDSHRTTVQVGKPGQYRVLSLSDQYCSATLESDKSCIVSAIPKPTLSVKHEPIISTCQFEIGLETTLMMSGQPPFTVKYREIVKLDSGVTKSRDRVLSASNLIHHLKLTPELSGLYRYQFYELASDDYGAVPVDIELKQLVKALPNTKFVDLSEIPARTCVDWPVHPSLATVRFTGNGPWALNYSIFHKDQISSQSLTHLIQSQTELSLPAFTSPGRHTVQLSRISDESGCHRSLDTPPLIIDVRSTGPSVAFQCGGDSGEFWALQGHDAHLPVRLSGEGPWKVNMSLPNDVNQVINVSKPSDGLPARLEGTYHLRGVQDGYCPGSVLPNQQCTLRWHPFPTLNLVPADDIERVNSHNFIKRGVCQGVPDNVGIVFTGRAPYHTEHTVTFPESDDLPLNLRAEVTNQTSLLTLDTSSPGAHVYTFYQIGDGLYSSVQPDNPIRLDQDVFARPSAWFTTPSPVHQCSTQDIDNVMIELSGQAPFNVVLEWRDHDQKPVQITLNDIPHSPHRFSLSGRAPGSHALRIVRVTDANDCMGGPDLGLDIDKPALLRVDVVAPPTLLPSSRAAHRSHACIGERLSYVLGGVSPWTVHYAVNGTARQAAQSDSHFRRLIDTPGVFHITQVCHLPGLGAPCCTTPSLSEVEIHPLPGAWLAGGSDQYINIHDGERTRIQVDLAGTPPFEFTYTRRALHTRHLLETHTVTDLPTSDYVIDTSLEGIFEVTAVQDRYCRYPFPLLGPTNTDGHFPTDFPPYET